MAVSPAVQIKADRGYQGIQEYHEWSLIPIKKSKTHPLSSEDCDREHQCRDKGMQDNGVSIPEQAAQTSVTHKTRLCDTQCRKNVTGYGTSLVDRKTCRRTAISPKKGLASLFLSATMEMCQWDSMIDSSPIGYNHVNV